jgi:putative Mg2+ transporter-C (MgtC) family protein
MNDFDAIINIFARLGLALIAGSVLGLNRWLHHKSAGIRTHSLVALGAAVGMLMIDSHAGSDAQAHSRVLQGLVTGIGFLGAGVIIREHNSRKIHGLTTAASVWTCALLGAAFGAGQYLIGVAALLTIMFIMLIGGRIEQAVGRALGITRESEVPEEKDEA